MSPCRINESKAIVVKTIFRYLIYLAQHGNPILHLSPQQQVDRYLGLLPLLMNYAPVAAV